MLRLKANLLGAKAFLPKAKMLPAKVLLPKGALLDWSAVGLSVEEKPQKTSTKKTHSTKVQTRTCKMRSNDVTVDHSDDLNNA